MVELEINVGLPSLIKPRERPVKALVIGASELHEHEVGLISKLDKKFEHDGKTYKVDSAKIFNERNFFGYPKQRYLFYLLNEKEKNPTEPTGIEDFNPEKTISAEEADLYLHEQITAKGFARMILGKGFIPSPKLLIFLGILGAVAVWILMKR